MQASLTVEATFALPIFIYVVLVFMYFLQILYIGEAIQSGITEVAKSSSNYAFLYKTIMENEQDSKMESVEGSGNESKDTSENETVESMENLNEEDSKTPNNSIISSLVDGTFYQLKLRDYVDVESINRSCIRGGYKGITFLKSSFMQDGETVDVIAIYRVRFPVLFFNLRDYTVVQRVRTRGFIGDKIMGEESDEEDSEITEEMVYVTKTGRVYHKTKECSHLKLSISNITFNSVGNARNSSGGKYKACEVCSKGKKIKGIQTVYITNDGDRYHTSLGCSGLKRTIYTIAISKVGNKKPCSRCGK